MSEVVPYGALQMELSALAAAACRDQANLDCHHLGKHGMNVCRHVIFYFPMEVFREILY